MDEFDARFTINELIIKDNIDIETIHLLSKKGVFTLAVSWIEFEEKHFKMFKNQNISNVKTFSDFLLEYNKYWHSSVISWIERPFIPLCLKAH